jgi:hypothetical protein
MLIFDAAKRYRELFIELLFRRKMAEQNNRELSEHEEAWFVEQLDECWRLMNEEQQKIAEYLSMWLSSNEESQ